MMVASILAPKGLKNLAQGFNPGKHPIKRFALKGREMAWAKCPSNATEKELGILGRRYNLPLANNAHRHQVERWRPLWKYVLRVCYL